MTVPRRAFSEASAPPSPSRPFSVVFFFNDTATTEIYTLSLHDALPIWPGHRGRWQCLQHGRARADQAVRRGRSEEHTSELQSPCNLVCRLLLEKKSNTNSPSPEPGVALPPGLQHACSAEPRPRITTSHI